MNFSSVRSIRRRRFLSVLPVALLALVVFRPASAQDVDVTGTWIFDVTTGQGSGTPTVTLEQEGGSLTGHYSSANLGEAELTGTVRGREIRFTFDTPLQGQTLTVVYEGTVQDDGSIEGTIDIGGLARGTFTASRE